MSQTARTTRRGSPEWVLLQLATPMIAITVSRMAMGFIDFVMVSRLGTDAQAAIMPASLMTWAFACLGLGLTAPVQTFVSQVDGRGEHRTAGAYAWQSLYLALLMGLMTTPAALTVRHWFPWLTWLGHHDPAVAQLEMSFLEWAIWLVGPATLAGGLEGFFNGIQRPRVALTAALISLSVNALGNWVLIFGHLGFPRMGIRGSALATVIGWTTRAAVLTVAMCLARYDARYNTRRALAASWPKVWALTKVGLPTAVQWLTDLGAWLAFTTLVVTQFGKAAMAATGIALQYMHLAFMPAVGIGMALTTQVGFAIGRRQPDEAEARVRTGLRLTAGYMGLIGLVMLVGRGWLIMPLNGDPAVVSAGAVIMIWAAVFQVFDATCLTYSFALRGAGDAHWPALLSLVLGWTVQVGGGAAMVLWMPRLGLHGPWLMCATYIGLSAAALVWRWRGGAWRRIQLFKHAPTAHTEAVSGPAVEVPSALGATAE